MSLIERCNGQSASGNACNTVASLTKNFLEFAAMLQMPRKTFRRLQQCCKCFEKLFGVCRNAASVPKNFSAFCRNAASASKNFLEFAGTLQVPRKTFWSLQQCCKHFQKCFSPSRDLRRTSLLALFLCRTHANKKLFRIY